VNESWITILSVVLAGLGVLAELNLMRIFLRDWREGRRQERARSFRTGPQGRAIDAAPVRRRMTPLGLAACLVALMGPVARGQESAVTGQPGATAAGTQPEAPPAPGPWSLGDATGLNDLLKPAKVTLSGYAEAGITLNPTAPQDRQNFGRLFDDRSNDFLLNQFTLTLDRAMETGDTFDWGGRVQFMYGSDARFIHYTGELDNVTSEPVQPTFIELFLTAHLPVLTKGGVDLKAGQFVTLMGAETIDPRSNYFYSRTYMFNSLGSRSITPASWRPSTCRATST
jgi:hypothetical protein